MARYFEDPRNSHREEVNGWASAGALCFGLFYFAVKGIWRHVVIQLLLIVLFFATLEAPGMMFAMLMWVIYAAMAQNIVASNYLRNGWREVSSMSASSRPATDPTRMKGRLAMSLAISPASKPISKATYDSRCVSA